MFFSLIFQAEQVDEFFSSCGNSYLCLHVAAYCFAVNTYNTLQPSVMTHQADTYRFLPSELIDHIMRHITADVHRNWPKETQLFVNFLVRYHNRMADFAQGQLLQSLGKGMQRAMKLNKGIRNLCVLPFLLTSSMYHLFHNSFQRAFDCWVSEGNRLSQSLLASSWQFSLWSIQDWQVYDL